MSYTDALNHINGGVPIAVAERILKLAGCRPSIVLLGMPMEMEPIGVGPFLDCHFWYSFPRIKTDFHHFHDFSAFQNT
jgi:hypothetical protein